MSYQVLEEWAALGIGAAILPQSKISAAAKAALPIKDKSGQLLTMRYQASWSQASLASAHLHDFAMHLRDIAPSLLAGLAVASATQ